MKKLSSAVLDRRQLIALALGSTVAIGLTACGGKAPAEQQASGSASADSPAGSDSATTVNVPPATEEQIKASKIDGATYDALVASISAANEDVIKANAWASKVKDAGRLRIGGVRTSDLFSIEMDDGRVRGFDMGLAQLLAKYILDDVYAVDIVQTDLAKRESMLQSDQVDAVIASYVITDERRNVVSFAGPYLVAHQGVLVNVNNESIHTAEDLAGKAVGIMKGSDAARLLREVAPQATVTEMDTDEELLAALLENRIEAYVMDSTVLMTDIVKHPGLYRLAAEFGPEIPCGIGVPLDSDGVAFINDFLRAIEENGTWAALWNVCIGKRVGIDIPPAPPAIA